MSNKKFHTETLALHAGLDDSSSYKDACTVPIYQTAAYVFPSCQHAVDRFDLKEEGNIYTRLTNPTEDILAKRIAAIDGGVAAMAVSSGAAAVTYALDNILLQGDHLIAANNLYGGTTNLINNTLPVRGISHATLDINDLEAVEKAIQPNTKAIYAETFGNPNADISNLDGISEVAHRHGIILIVDNTFAPGIFRPLDHGADVVVYSATKFIGGHGSTMGGLIVDGGRFDWKANADRYPTLAKPDPSYHGGIFADMAGAAAFVTRCRTVVMRDTGACISPFNAWLLLEGLETLPLRMERHVQNALKVVRYLSDNPKVEKVNHPSLPTHPDHALYEKYFPNGGGSIFTFDIKGGKEAAWKFIDSLRVFSLIANVGDAKSLVIHPATTTHSQLTPEELAAEHITPSTIRLSVGIEHIDDLLEDLDQAFAKI